MNLSSKQLIFQKPQCTVFAYVTNEHITLLFKCMACIPPVLSVERDKGKKIESPAQEHNERFSQRTLKRHGHALQSDTH
jgi:hypothetical protein